MQQTRTITRIDPRTVPAAKARGAQYTSIYARLAQKILHRTRVHLAVYILAFYLMPAIMPGASTVLLTLAFPSFCFLASAGYGFRYGFITHYLAIPIALFFPASFLFFKAYSFLYALCYLLIACIALMIGAVFKQSYR